MAQDTGLNAMQGNFREEFPDYAPDSLPPIPPTWRDQSWHNDSCPCWNTDTGLLVYVDYADVAEREHNNAFCRFMVMADPEIHNHSDLLFESDDWQAVLYFVEVYPCE